MRLNKCQQFVNDLNAVLNSFSRDYIKSSIGDSTNNNRTLTVRQVVRFLNRAGRGNLADTLTAIYKRISNDILNDRTVTQRTDAVDINEFLNVLTTVMQSTTTVQSLAQVISRVA